MNVYLDDERETPAGWLRAYWPDEVVAFLKSGKVKQLSLDHDLGNDNKAMTFYSRLSGQCLLMAFTTNNSRLLGE